jgi:hypothetical protein
MSGRKVRSAPVEPERQVCKEVTQGGNETRGRANNFVLWVGRWDFE